MAAFDEEAVLRAVAAGELDVANHMIESDPALVLRALNSEGCSALWIAVLFSHLAVEEALLAVSGIEVNGTMPPLCIACHMGDSAIVARLLDAPGIEVNLATLEGGTPLHQACRNGHAAIVELLLGRADIEVNCTGSCGGTPLHHACQQGHAAVVQLLLDASGVDGNPADNGGGTPLHHASQQGHPAVVQLLLSVPGLRVDAPSHEGATSLM